MRTHRASAAEDRVRLLRDDAEVGDGQLGAGTESAAEGEGHLLVEEDGLAGHEREGAREVVLVQMRRRVGVGAEPRGRVDEGLLEVASEHGLALYDITALVPIVEEAGGRFSALTGPLTDSTSSVLATNGLLHITIQRELGVL